MQPFDFFLLEKPLLTNKHATLVLLPAATIKLDQHLLAQLSELDGNIPSGRKVAAIVSHLKVPFEEGVQLDLEPHFKEPYSKTAQFSRPNTNPFIRGMLPMCLHIECLTFWTDGELSSAKRHTFQFLDASW